MRKIGKINKYKFKKGKILNCKDIYFIVILKTNNNKQYKIQ